MNCVASISGGVFQQIGYQNCGVYAALKARSLNFGTIALAHHFIRRIRVMMGYKLVGDLY